MKKENMHIVSVVLTTEKLEILPTQSYVEKVFSPDRAYARLFFINRSRKANSTNAHSIGNTRIDREKKLTDDKKRGEPDKGQGGLAISEANRGEQLPGVKAVETPPGDGEQTCAVVARGSRGRQPPTAETARSRDREDARGASGAEDEGDHGSWAWQNRTRKRVLAFGARARRVW